MRKMLVALASAGLVVTLAMPAGASMSKPQRGGPGQTHVGHRGDGGSWGHDDHGHRGDRDHRDGDHRNGDHRDGRFRGGYPGYGDCDRDGFSYGRDHRGYDDCDRFSRDRHDCCNS